MLLYQPCDAHFKLKISRKRRHYMLTP